MPLNQGDRRSDIFAAFISLEDLIFQVGDRMSDTVEVSREVFEPIAMLVRDGLFKDEKDALKTLVLDQAASKIRHFDSLIEEMRAKYDMSFEVFEKRIKSRKGFESFDEWDDFIIWESYESAREYWTGVQASLKGLKE